MGSVFHKLTAHHLATLAKALREGRLCPPFSPVSVGHYVPQGAIDPLTAELQKLVTEGMLPTHIAFTLELLQQERTSQQELDNRLELVWTGPDVPKPGMRDTAVVVRELFRQATTSVLIASYSLDRPEHIRQLFGELANKMDHCPDLKVRMFVDVHRKKSNQTTPALVWLRQFAENFRQNLWPGTRLPEVFYDPRALEDGEKQARLHAKCVIVDDRQFFITSANFSKAAHTRNIEAGILLDDPRRAIELRQRFDTLISTHHLHRLAGLA